MNRAFAQGQAPSLSLVEPQIELVRTDESLHFLLNVIHQA